MEQELDRRVREALDTPPPERRPINNARSLQHQRRLEELEKLNSHVASKLAGKDSDSIQHRRWKVLQAKRRMKKIMVDKELGFDGSDLSPQYKMDLLLENQMKSNYNTTDTSSFNIGYDSTSAIAALNRIKTQEYYAKVASKATSNFAGLTESEKHEFYYSFTKMGFREALRTGKLPDGSCLEELENGKYRDRFGIVRDVHGPFWPSDYGPLHPSPVHVRPRPEKQELFSAGPEGKNNNSNLQ